MYHGSVFVGEGSSVAKWTVRGLTAAVVVFVAWSGFNEWRALPGGGFFGASNQDGIDHTRDRLPPETELPACARVKATLRESMSEGDVEELGRELGRAIDTDEETAQFCRQVEGLAYEALVAAIEERIDG